MSDLDFCSRCFASSKDGSWGCTVYDDWCTNCGASGTVKLPAWAIKSIREQASWVGKRYYPAQEDKDRDREVRYLRSIHNSAPFLLWTAQRDGLSITFHAASHTDASRIAKQSLPVPVPNS